MSPVLAYLFYLVYFFYLILLHIYIYFGPLKKKKTNTALYRVLLQLVPQCLVVCMCVVYVTDNKKIKFVLLLLWL